MPTQDTCSIGGCDRGGRLKRGLCGSHYHRLQRYGDPLGNGSTSAEIRFWLKVDRTDTCWLWTASVTAAGYAQLSINNRPHLGHRLAYEWLVGPIPPGTELDHLCRTPACVRPEHLEPVPHVVNVLRGQSPMAINARKTHCVHGHEFTPANTYIHPTRGKRHCLACQRLHGRKKR